MAVNGSFRIETPGQTLRNMKIDTCGYIFCTSFILSRKLLCIDLDTEVFYKIEDILDLNFDNYIAVYKIKDGLSEDCFDLDIEEDPYFNDRDWGLEAGHVTKPYLDNYDWVCFPDPPIYNTFSCYESHYGDTEQIESDISEIEEITQKVIVSGEIVMLSSTKEGLQEQLNESVFAENYELSAIIRDEIERIINIKE